MARHRPAGTVRHPRLRSRRGKRVLGRDHGVARQHAGCIQQHEKGGVCGTENPPAVSGWSARSPFRKPSAARRGAPGNPSSPPSHPRAAPPPWISAHKLLEQPRRIPHNREAGLHVRLSLSTHREGPCALREIGGQLGIDLLGRDEKTAAAFGQPPVPPCRSAFAPAGCSARWPRPRPGWNRKSRSPIPGRLPPAASSPRHFAPRGSDVRHRVEQRRDRSRNIHRHRARGNRSAQVSAPSVETVPGLRRHAHIDGCLGGVVAVGRAGLHTP